MNRLLNPKLLILTLATLTFLGSTSGCRKSIADRWAASQRYQQGFMLEKGRAVFRTNNPEPLARHWDEPVDADPTTFKAFFTPKTNPSFPYAKDQSKVFIGVGKRVYELEGADPQSITILDDYGLFAKDQQYVYFVGIRLQDAQANSFQTLGKLYAKDAKNVFFGPIPLPQADPNSFEPLSHGFLSLEQIDHGGGGPFRSLRVHEERDEIKYSGAWAKDLNHCFYGPRIIRDTDPPSFKLLNPGEAEDRNWIFSEEGVNSLKQMAKQP